MSTTAIVLELENFLESTHVFAYQYLRRSNVGETITIKVDLHEGDMAAIRNGKLDVRDAVELSLNHGHNLEIISVEEGTKKT